MRLASFMMRCIIYLSIHQSHRINGGWLPACLRHIALWVHVCTYGLYLCDHGREGTREGENTTHLYTYHFVRDAYVHSHA